MVAPPPKHGAAISPAPATAPPLPAPKYAAEDPKDVKTYRGRNILHECHRFAPGNGARMKP